MIAQPELERVEPELIRELVDRALEREHARGFARRARERRRHGIPANEAVDAFVTGARVHLPIGPERRLRPVVERRRDGELVMANAGESAITGRAERHVVLLLLAMPAGGEHLLACQGELYRPPTFTCGPGG